MKMLTRNWWKPLIVRGSLCNSKSSSARLLRTMKCSCLSLEGVDVGALYLGRRDEDMWLELMEVAPDRQGQGLGAAALSWVVEQSAKASCGTMLQVHKVNARAKRLHERRGLAEVGETETHHLLRHP
ncbi:GNAT family N-acetyltransferase [Brevibacterium aurantiacum]|uniref:GNAT family N-acetyltransferase n=1 Tax=Brevibacterium aurantiacum TaxID=273384 RepID=UPI003851129E